MMFATIKIITRSNLIEPTDGKYGIGNQLFMDSYNIPHISCETIDALKDFEIDLPSSCIPHTSYFNIIEFICAMINVLISKYQLRIPLGDCLGELCEDFFAPNGGLEVWLYPLKTIDQFIDMINGI